MYTYPDSPNDTLGWSMCTSPPNNDDYQLSISTGGYDISTGDLFSLTYAAFAVEGISLPCPDITPILDAQEVISDYYQSIATDVVDIGFFNKDLSVYPNPVIDEVKFDITSSDQYETFRVRVFDMQGLLITELYDYIPQQKLDVSGLPTGLFVVHIINEKGLINTVKFMKIDK